jgi:hypothetical protein
MNFEKMMGVVVVAGCAAFALAGCAVDAETVPVAESSEGAKPAPATSPDEAAADAENIAKTTEALTSGGGGGGLGFSCGALGCICHGDWDCNNMFDGPACGSWPAKCYDRGPSQYCICAPWVKKTASAVTPGNTAGGAVLSR